MSKKVAKVRFVRCPKCWVILPELADVPVYKCGECNAVLKAKIRKEDGEGADSKALEHSLALKDESEQHSKIEDLDSSSQKVKLSSTDAANQVESEDLHKKPCENKNMSNEISSANDISCQEKEESSYEAGEKREAAHDDGGYSDSGSSSPDSQVFSGESSLDSTGQRPRGKILIQINNSFSDRQPETSANILSCDANHLTSRDVQIAEPNDYNFTSNKDMDEAKFSGRLRDVSKSSTTRTSHVCDGSISSYDDWDDQVSDQHHYLHKRPSFESQGVAESINSEGLSPRAAFRLCQKKNIKIEEKIEARKFSSLSLNEKHSSATERDEILKPIRHEVQARQPSTTHGYEGFHQASLSEGLERGRILSKEHTYWDHNSPDYDHAGPSNYQHKEFLHSSNLYSPEKLKYDEYNQMELLRKVDELRDQLNRSYAHQRKASEKFLATYAQQEKQWPFQKENLQHLKTSYSLQHLGALRPRKSTNHHCACSKMSFSGSRINYMHNTDCSVLRSYCEDSQCLRHEGGLYRPQPCYICRDSYSSSSSPQRQLYSNIPFQGCKRQPCHRMLRDIDNKAHKYHKERHQTLKRHYRPVAGAAPFIICYSCSEILHIPADFLHTSKRYHQLKCGSCSKVLTFSLHKRFHVVPYSSKSVVPTAIEVDNSRATTSTNSSHAHCDCPNGDPVSYSEDYGLSTCKSCSTESEGAFPSPQFPSLQIRTAENNMQPSSTYSKLTVQEKEKSVVRQSSNKHKSSMEVHNKPYAVSSSNLAELKPQTTGSPLHRLLGYSSPSAMINGPVAARCSSNSEVIN